MIPLLQPVKSERKVEMSNNAVRLTMTRTSVKDKMFEKLDQIVATTDALRDMINRHVGALPAADAEELASALAVGANAYRVPPAIQASNMPKERKTRKKREAARPEVMIAPEAAASPVAQNIKVAIENVKDPNAELKKQLAKVTCPGGPAAFNTFRKRLAELFNQVGISVTYDRMLEIAGPLYKTMCQNPIYAGTGRNGKPGVPFDMDQLAALRDALDRTQSLLRLSPEIMARIEALANGENIGAVAPLTNMAVSMQKQRAALGMTKRGKTKKVANNSAAAAPAAAAPPPLAPVYENENEGATAAMTIPTVPLATAGVSLGKRIPDQLTRLQREMNTSAMSIQGMRDRMKVLGSTIPGVESRISQYNEAAQEQLTALQTLRNQFARLQEEGVATKENKDTLKSLIKDASKSLKETEKQIQTMGLQLSETESKARAAAYMSNLGGAAVSPKLSGSIGKVATMAARTANRLNTTVKKTKKKTAQIMTPSGAVYQPGVSVGAVKPGPSNLLNSNLSSYPASLYPRANNSPVASPAAESPVASPFATTAAAAPAAVSMFPEPLAALSPENQNASASLSGQQRVAVNYFNNTNADKPYRFVIAKVPSASGKNEHTEEIFLMGEDGVLYDPEIVDSIEEMSKNGRQAYQKGIYNAETQKLNLRG